MNNGCQIDANAIRQDVRLLARLANGAAGKLVATGFGEDPCLTTKLMPKVIHGSPTNPDGFADAMLSMGGERHRNLYLSLAVFTPDLRDGLKGGEAEVLCVLGVVAEFDAKNDPHAGEWATRLPMPPTMVLETSTLPAPSFQCRYLFTRPIAPAHAKRIAVMLTEATGADPVCKDFCHVWRPVGGLNWPNRRKVQAGRPLEPQAVKVVVPFTDDRLIDPDELERKLSALAPSAQVKAEASDAPKVDAANARALQHPDELGAGVSDLAKVVIVNGEDAQGRVVFPSRSEAVYWVACELVRSGLDDATILGVLRHPTWGIGESIREKGKGAARYAARQVERARAAVAEADADFHTDEKGNPFPIPHNIRVSIHKQGARLWWDEFADRKFIEGLAGFGPHLDDKAVVRLWINAQEHHKLRVGKEFFHDVVSDFALSNRRHPVRSYLEEVADTWDETPRVDSWLIDYAGAPDTPYVRAVSRLSLVAAVRRILSPGCKFDEMPVLEGPQGGGKSSLLRTLCPDEAWFTDDLPLDGDAKRFIEAVKGKWIVEAGELKGMRKAEADALKSALSRQVDRARMAYGREPVELARQCVIFGTTNSERYLKDTTGNRRYWPIRCGALKVAALAQVRDQLWAEAARMEAEGASIRLDPSLYPHATEAQDARRQEDPFMEALEPALAGLVGKLRAQDAWSIVGKQDVGHRTQDDMNRLGEAMRLLGWERAKRRFGGTGPEWCYVKGASEAERARTVVYHADDGGWREALNGEGVDRAF